MLLAALAVGLRYVDTSDPGIARRRRGTGFAYLDADARRITDRDTLERIAALAIPPGVGGGLDLPIPARPHPSRGT